MEIKFLCHIKLYKKGKKKTRKHLGKIVESLVFH